MPVTVSHRILFFIPLDLTGPDRRGIRLARQQPLNLLLSAGQPSLPGSLPCLPFAFLRIWGGLKALPPGALS